MFAEWEYIHKHYLVKNFLGNPYILTGKKHNNYEHIRTLAIDY